MSLFQAFNNLTPGHPLYNSTVFLGNKMKYNFVKNHDISHGEMYKKDLSGWRSEDSSDVDSRIGDSNKLNCEISFRDSLTRKGLAPKNTSSGSPGTFILVIL